MDQSRVKVEARSAPLFLRRSSMLSALASGGISSRGPSSDGPVMAPAAASDFYYAAPTAEKSSIVPGVPDWALAVAGVAVAGVAVLILRSRRGRR